MQAIVQKILDSGKYTEQEIAQYAGVSAVTIRRIKLGKTKKTRHIIWKRILCLYCFVLHGDKRDYLNIR
jgi:transcriptional regulator with XRE-family HTH domain